MISIQRHFSLNQGFKFIVNFVPLWGISSEGLRKGQLKSALRAQDTGKRII